MSSKIKVTVLESDICVDLTALILIISDKAAVSVGIRRYLECDVIEGNVKRLIDSRRVFGSEDSAVACGKRTVLYDKLRGISGICRTLSSVCVVKTSLKKGVLIVFKVKAVKVDNKCAVESIKLFVRRSACEIVSQKYYACRVCGIVYSADRLFQSSSARTVNVVRSDKLTVAEYRKGISACVCVFRIYYSVRSDERAFNKRIYGVASADSTRTRKGDVLSFPVRSADNGIGTTRGNGKGGVLARVLTEEYLGNYAVVAELKVGHITVYRTAVEVDINIDLRCAVAHEYA